jgi:hypothetical protein
VGLGVGVGETATVKVREIVGNVPDPHDVEVDPPGLSAANAVQINWPAEEAVPEIWNTALSPLGRPTSGFLSGGFLNVTIDRPVAEPVTTTQPWTAGLVTPLTETIVADATLKADGTETWIHVISSPPPLPPTFRTVRVTVDALAAGSVVGLALRVQARAARTVAGRASIRAPTIRTARSRACRRCPARLTRLSGSVSSRQRSG